MKLECRKQQNRSGFGNHAKELLNRESAGAMTTDFEARLILV